MRESINHVILSFRHHATFPDVSVSFRKSGVRLVYLFLGRKGRVDGSDIKGLLTRA